MASADVFNTANLGVGKGRAGGYSAVAPANTDPSAYIDVKKTIKELIEASGSVVKSLGYIGEDGLTKTTDTSAESYKDWRGDEVASGLSEYSESVQVPFLESRESVLQVVFGDENVTSSEGTTVIRRNQNFNGAHLFIFDSVVSDTKVKRTIIPNGVILERDDISENSSDLVTYTPTIKCLPSSFFEGDCYREYIYDTAYTPATA